MRQWIAILVCAPALLVAQQSTSVSTQTSVDINGHRIQEGPQVVRTKSPSGVQTTERSQTINGRTVPTERVDERILREDATGRVVERIIQRYDPLGNPTAPVRETIEEQKRPDGSSTIQTATYRGDINGRMQLAEKTVADVRSSGSQETSEKVTQRPTINGSLDTVEKESKVTVKDSSGGYRQDTTTYRRDAKGAFYAAVRKDVEHTQRGSQSTDDTAEYEIGPTGQLQLHGRTISKTVTAADGSKNTVTDIFGPSVPGTVGDAGALKLQERQVVEQKQGGPNELTETVSVRRPTVSDPKTLEPARELSQTVCRGNCKQ